MSNHFANLIAKQKQELQEQLARLEQADFSALEAKKAKLLQEVEEIDEQIAEIIKSLGITSKPSLPSTSGKSHGILVSLNRLLELFKEHKTNELSVRGLRLDTKQVKKLVAENPEKLELGGKGPWPVVKLKTA